MHNGSKTVAGGGVLFGLKVKSPCLRGVPHHVLGLQCHPMGCNFSMKWFVVWITVTQATCQTPRFGKLGHARRSMGPKRSLERVLFSLKSPCWRGVQRHVLCLECHPSGWNFRLEWLVWINGISETCRTSSIGEWVHAKSSMGPKQ